MNKSYVWTLPTRIFHAFFAVFILIGFLSAEDNWLNFHAIIGYGVFILLFFRVVWGFIGPKHSRFKEFPTGRKNLKEFSKEIFSDRSKYTGHNPIASYVMIAILVTVFLTIISGILAYGIQEGKGIASSLNYLLFKEMKLFKEIHELLTAILIALIVAHITGVLVDRLLHGKNKTLNSIATGYKMTENKEVVKLNIYQKIFSFLMLVFFIGFLIFNLRTPKNILTASIFKSVDYGVQNELFVKECASCHTLYPTKSFT